MARPTLLWLAGCPAVMLMVLGWLQGQDPGTLLRELGTQLAGWRVAPIDLVGPVLALVLSHVLRAARLRAEWLGRRPMTLGDALQVSLMHNAAVNLLPLRSGELGYPWLMRQRFGVPLSQAATSLVWMRLQDALVLAWLGLAAWTLGRTLTAGSTESLWLLCLPWVLGTTALAAGAWHIGGLAQALHRWWQPRQAAASGAPLQQGLARLLAALLAAGQHQRPLTWAWCLANWLVKLTAIAALLGVFGGAAGLPAWLGAWGGEVATALPLQPPAGFGTYEAGVVGVATHSTAIGTAARVAPLTMLLYAAWLAHLVVLGVAVVGAAAAWVARLAMAPGAPPAQWQEGL